jgi:hypothetical protein
LGIIEPTGWRASGEGAPTFSLDSDKGTPLTKKQRKELAELAVEPDSAPAR